MIMTRGGGATAVITNKEGDRRELFSARPLDAIGQISNWATSSDSQLRIAAARTAARNHSFVGTRSVIEHLCADPDGRVRRVAAWSAATLLREGDSLGLELLENLLADELMTVRAVAIHSLGHAAEHSEAAIDSLIDCTTSLEPELAYLAGSVLAKAVSRSTDRCLKRISEHRLELVHTEARAGLDLLRVVIQVGVSAPRAMKKILDALARHRVTLVAEGAREALSNFDCPLPDPAMN